ncbi:MAG: FAD-binding protein [Hyphomicrobiaceae bacterium]|nr:MAG: FAD-binding protein [Hyphomicrobiaceae bacterium]
MTVEPHPASATRQGHNRPRDTSAAVADLRARFQDRVQTGEAVRRQHAHTLTYIANEPPDAVVFPTSPEEVQDVVKICARHRAPIIPFGAGTSLEGHVNAPEGGISIDLQTHMNKVLRVNAEDLDAVVEAGISRGRLNEHLRDTGLFFSVDPGTSDATIGGMASTRASGTTAVRYGTMRENVLSLKVVLADGSLIETSRRARKSSAGYDLTRLFVGAEGTLGIITEATVRLFGQPESILAAVCAFKTLEGACNTTIQAIQLGLGLARIELLDAVQIQAVNSYSKLSLAPAPTLFLEFHGTPAGTREQVETFRTIAEAEGALGFDWAEREEDRKRLWKARHDVYWAVKSAWPGKNLFATDVCVPISRLAECIRETEEDIKKTGLIAPIVGHVGDGNFHLTPLFDEKSAAEVKLIEDFLVRLVERALRMDGTCTGEHGVGQGKMKYLKTEHGPALAAMRALKKALDPDDIMNPGKIIPAY